MSNARALEVEASIGAGLDSDKMDEVSSVWVPTSSQRTIYNILDH